MAILQNRLSLKLKKWSKGAKLKSFLVVVLMITNQVANGRNLQDNMGMRRLISFICQIASAHINKTFIRTVVASTKISIQT
jgi:hypothetical protein